MWSIVGHLSLSFTPCLDVCFNSSLQTYLFHLQEGLVYVVGLSDDVADMAGKRPNVLTIKAKCPYHYPYRMLVGMVDMIFAEIDHHPEQRVLYCSHKMMSNIIFCTLL